MKFSKEFLRELYWEREYVHQESTGDSRWLRDYWAVFEYEGKLYGTTFSVGKTELQEYKPYEDDPDEIECPEVHAVTELVEVTRYKNVGES